MTDIIPVTYWVRLHGSSQPIQTEDLKMVFGKKLPPNARVIAEARYPSKHVFEYLGPIPSFIPKEYKSHIVNTPLGESRREDEAIKLFNQFDKYLGQNMRKKSSKAKPPMRRKSHK